MFPVIAVPDDAPNLTEQLGTKEKFWYENAAKVPWLFKLGRPNSGDDWSEKVACELCKLLRIPHADYQFATHKDQRGVVTPTFVPRDGRLVHGNELLAKIVDRYPVKEFFGVREHTLNRVLAILRHAAIKTPIGCETLSGIESALDFFVGYLMLDAWVANQDRHHENWGLVVGSEMTIHLAPSYDHASCLGANETDDNRRDRLTTTDVGRSMERYVERARSAFYPSASGQKAMSPMDAFCKAATMRPEAAKVWLRRLKQLPSQMTLSIFERIPDDRISSVARHFAQRLLDLNRERLLVVTKELE